MAKVVVKSLKSQRISKAPKSVATKRVRDAQGKVTIVRTLDLSSETFGRDLQYVFGKNVQEARRRAKQSASSDPVGSAGR